MADDARDARGVECSAWRSRNRRLRAFWRHEQQAVRMAVAAATHRGRQTMTLFSFVFVGGGRKGVSTFKTPPVCRFKNAPALVVEYVALPPAATCDATPAPAPVTEHVAPAPCHLSSASD